MLVLRDIHKNLQIYDDHLSALTASGDILGKSRYCLGRPMSQDVHCFAQLRPSDFVCRAC